MSGETRDTTGGGLQSPNSSELMGDARGADGDSYDDGDSIDNVLQRAQALASYRRLDAAAAELRQGLAEYPESAELWARLALVMYQLDDEREAQHCAANALRHDPENVTALYLQATLAAASGDAERAHAAADELLRLIPDTPAAHLSKARALAAEPGGEQRHRALIREGAYWAIGLDPENADTLVEAAVLLKPIVSKSEFSGLIAHGLSLDPNNEALQIYSSDAHTKTDGQMVGVLSGILAQNPQQSAASFVITTMLWERTRWIAALAVWGSAAVVLPQALLVVLVIAIVNFYMLFIGIPRKAPKGLVRRTWSEPRWARIGVICAFVGALWPPLLVLAGVSGALRFVALLPLALLVGETIIVFAANEALGRGVRATFGDAAADYVRGELRSSYKGGVRIAIGALMAAISVTALAVGAVVEGQAQLGLFAAVLVLALAFAVPPMLVMALRGRLLRELLREHEGEQLGEPARPTQAGFAERLIDPWLKNIATVVIVCAALLTAGAAVLGVALPQGDGAKPSAPSEESIDPADIPTREELERTQEQLQRQLEDIEEFKIEPVDPVLPVAP